jgi:hypothetical protein
MLWMCTIVRQGRGRQLSSLWHVRSLLQLRLGTWLCSLGDTRRVNYFVFGEICFFVCCMRFERHYLLRCGDFGALASAWHITILLQAAPLMRLTCTTVQQGRGRQLGSAWLAIPLQPHRSGTYRSLRGEKNQVGCFSRV